MWLRMQRVCIKSHIFEIISKVIGCNSILIVEVFKLRVCMLLPLTRSSTNVASLVDNMEEVLRLAGVALNFSGGQALLLYPVGLKLHLKN